MINIFIAVAFWVADGFIDYFLFNGESLIEAVFFPGSHEIWMRSFVFFIFTVQGFVAQSVVDRLQANLKKQGELDCDESRKSLEKTARVHSRQN